MNIVGLENTLEYINKSSLDNFPHSLLLLGKEGSGKTLLCSYISEHLKLNLVDITDDLSEELINNIYRNPNPQMYKIDVRKLAEKKQNIFLKLFEEPGSAFVVVVANTKFQLLNTVINRGFIIETESYSKEQLLEVAKTNNIVLPDDCIDLLKTPGDVLKVYSNNIDFNKISDLVDKIAGKIDKACFPNMLTVVDKINFKDEYDKIDLDMLMIFLYNNLVNRYIETKENKYYKMSIFVNDFLKKVSFDSRLNKKLLFTNTLINIWECARG